ncbi:MAG: metalloregulator ArsR/SmtB family transcription factor [Pseudomonadota bacterium]
MNGLDRVFTALGDGTRRAILARLVHGEASLSEIASPFDMSQTAVSKHVRVLADAGLLQITKRGRTRYCELEAAPMKNAVAWLETYQRFWSGQFDALSKHLEVDK